MKKEEYDSKLSEIEDEMRAKKKSVACDYALSNAEYEVGDIISDHTSIILIDKVKWGYGYKKYPECVYFGYRLKKNNLTPRADESRDSIYQSNVKKMHNHRLTKKA